MKRRRKERPENEGEAIEMEVSPQKKAKKKKSDKEREVVKEELPHGQDEGSDSISALGGEEGAEVPPGKKLKKEKKKKKKKKHESTTSHETLTTGGKNSDVHMHCTTTPGTQTGRHCTVSIALPGSIIDNAQTHELKTYLAGQIARTAAVFCIDEIIVFDEQGKPSATATAQGQKSDPNIFLARLLQYQETPQYLRKTLFPMHRDLKFAGLLNPLDCPHHMRTDDVCQYREGVVVEPPAQGNSKKRQSGSQVDCGMKKRVVIDKSLRIGTRVTVNLCTQTERSSSKLLRGEAVAPSVPRTHAGLYWGYNVRVASSFSAIFTESPYERGYDVTIGTSERGESIDTLMELPSFQHLLIVFGGLKGLEYSLECDDALQIGDVSLLFHHYLNTCPDQGSRTIRTEEALLISLAALRPLICKNTVQSASRT